MKMMILFTTLLLLTLSLSAQSWEWAVSAGASALDRVWDLTTDPDGNILVTGEFTDTLQAGNITIPGWGLNDICVIKYNPQGQMLWAKAFGGNEGDIGLSIDCDSTGNSYITGYYGGTAHFENQNLTTAGSWDIFVLKLDPNGNKLWVYSEGGASNDIGYGLAVMPDGRCFVTSWFGGTINFHNGSSLVSYGGSDILTYALAADGSLLWQHKAGDTGVEYGYKIDIDALANCYITGSAGAGCNFDGMTAPGNGMFIASYDSNGIIRWVNTGINAGVNSIATDREPAVIEQLGCVTGRVTGTGIFDDMAVTSVDGSDDAYAAQFELLTGNWMSAYGGGGTGSDKGRACAYRRHPYYVGSFEDTANLFGFDAIASGAEDGFVFSDGAEDEDWVLQEGGVNNDAPTDIVLDAAGNIYICGWFSGIARFGSSIMINSGNDANLDMFIAKINPNTSAEDNLSPPPQSGLLCYPNPFLKKLIIEAEITDTKRLSPFSVDIFNVKGQKVQTLHSAQKTGDVRQIEWNGLSASGRKCPAGIYVLKSTIPHTRIMKTIKL